MPSFVAYDYLCLLPLLSQILFRSLFDAVFAITVLIEMILRKTGNWEYTDCRGFSFFTQMGILGAELCFFFVSLDYFFSVRNPFVDSRKSVFKYRIAAFLLAAVSAAVLVGAEGAGLTEFGVCWAKPEKFNFTHINPFRWGLFYAPVFLFFLLSTAIVIFVQRRLAKGLRDTQLSRASTLRRSKTHLLCYVVYWVACAAFYLSTLGEEHEDTINVARSLFVAVFCSKGLATFVPWMIQTSFTDAVRAEREWQEKVRILGKRNVSRATLNSHLAPHLNLSLRREILHYTLLAIRLSLIRVVGEAQISNCLQEMKHLLADEKYRQQQANNKGQDGVSYHGGHMKHPSNGMEPYRHPNLIRSSMGLLAGAAAAAGTPRLTNPLAQNQHGMNNNRKPLSFPPAASVPLGPAGNPGPSPDRSASPNGVERGVGGMKRPAMNNKPSGRPSLNAPLTVQSLIENASLHAPFNDQRPYQPDERLSTSWVQIDIGLHAPLFEGGGPYDLSAYLPGAFNGFSIPGPGGGKDKDKSAETGKHGQSAESRTRAMTSIFDPNRVSPQGSATSATAGSSMTNPAYASSASASSESRANNPHGVHVNVHTMPNSAYNNNNNNSNNGDDMEQSTSSLNSTFPPRPGRRRDPMPSVRLEEPTIALPDPASPVATSADNTGVLRRPNVKVFDLAPDIFARIRDLRGISPAAHLFSLSRTTRERFSEGASGAFMAFSHDYKYVLKTMEEDEAQVLKRMLPQYLHHLRENPGSLIVKFLGCMRLEMYNAKITFVIMEAVWPTSALINDRYDLKGSWIGRSASKGVPGTQAYCRFCSESFRVGDKRYEGKCAARPNQTCVAQTVQKDNDLNFKLRLHETDAKKLAHQMRLDVAFLRRMKVMDYSLLLGVHNRQVNLQHLNQRNNSLKPNSAASPHLLLSPRSVLDTPSGFSANRLRGGTGGAQDSPYIPPLSLPGGIIHSNSDHYPTDAHAINIRGSIDGGADTTDSGSNFTVANPLAMRRGTNPPLPPHLKQTRPTSGLQGSVLELEEGMQANVIEGPGTYYVGIIDILQEWTLIKRLERFFKTKFMMQDGKGISVAPPDMYADRFEQRVIRTIIDPSE